MRITDRCRLLYCGMDSRQCGIIYTRDGSPRIAYDYLVKVGVFITSNIPLNYN